MPEPQVLPKDPTYLVVYRLIAVDSKNAFTLNHEHAFSGLAPHHFASFEAEVKWYMPAFGQETDAICCLVDISETNDYGVQAGSIYTSVVGDISPIAPSVMPQETLDSFISGWPMRTQQVAGTIIPKLKEAGFTIQRAFTVITVGDKQWGRFVAVRGNDVVDVLIADF